jgi:hypothetical protein
VSRRNGLIRHSVSKADRQLGTDHALVLTPSSPLFRNVHDRQIQHLQKTVTCWKNGLGFGHFTEQAIEALHGIGGVNQSPDFLLELEIGVQIGLIILPEGRRLGIFLVSPLSKDT